MSYNITSWKTKKMEDLSIPLEAFYESEREDWHPDQPKILDVKESIVEIYGGCGQSIIGKLENRLLHVQELNLIGEGSGSFMRYVMNHAFSESTGALEAILIWEGQEVYSYKVNDGNIIEEEYEL